MQGVADVDTPEDVLHKLQLLQKDAVSQNDRLAQAAAQADNLTGAHTARRSQSIRQRQFVFLLRP